METLKAYLVKKQISVEAFAKSAKIAPSTIYRGFNGESSWDNATCLKIERETNGKIKASKLIAEQLRRMK